MGIVNQRVCDLNDCAQPITEKSKVTFVMPETEEGDPDVSRRAEFEDPKCARNFLRGLSRTAKDARLAAQIAALTDNAANKPKRAELTLKLSGKSEVDYPKAVAA